MPPTSIETLALGNRLRIAYHDSWRKLLVNGQALPLTPTEYRICISFFQESPANLSMLTQEDMMLVSYISVRTLQNRAAISNRQLLRKHVSNCNSKLAPHGLHIAPFENGYILSAIPLSLAS